MLDIVLAIEKRREHTESTRVACSEFTSLISLRCMRFVCRSNLKRFMDENLSVEEALWQQIGISYHVVNIAAGDLGAPAAKKYDIEYWSPVDQTYRELTSCSNCTDYQARGLNIRVRRENGTIESVHTLNGTAVSLARSLVVILENFQNRLAAVDEQAIEEKLAFSEKDMNVVANETLYRVQKAVGLRK